MTTSPKRYINPYKLFYGAFIPNWLLRRAEISQGAKLVYARMCQYAGEKGECFPNQDVLAREIGLLHSRQARRHIKELEQSQLIEVQRLGKQCSNRYLFLEHEWMSDRTSTSGHFDMSDRTNCPFTNCSDRTELSSGDRTSTSGLIEIESVLRESITTSKSIVLAELLFELILKNNPKSRIHNLKDKDRKATCKRWAKDIDLLIRIDRQDSSDIENVIRWCQQDDFWKPNIMSGKKLREKWDTLIAQLSRSRVSNSSAGKSKTNFKKEDDEEQVQDVAGNPLKDL